MARIRSGSPTLFIASTIFMRSALDRARRSNLVTAMTSPFRSDPIIRSNCERDCETADTCSL